jgi:AcrR family transcriptional regulator
MIERGSIDIPISDIAARANVNTALIKYHFGKKHGLMQQLLLDIVAKPMEDLDKLIALDASAPEKLRIHINAMISIYYDFPFFYRLMHHLLTECPDGGQVVAEKIVRPLIDAESKILEQGHREGQFRKIDPELFYFHLIGACDHLFFGHYALRFACGIDKVDDQLRTRYARHLHEVIVRGLAP